MKLIHKLDAKVKFDEVYSNLWCCSKILKAQDQEAYFKICIPCNIFYGNYSFMY